MNLKQALRGRNNAQDAETVSNMGVTDRYPDFNSAYAELKRNLRRADGELQQVVREINLDNAGPTNAGKRRTLYPSAIKAYKKALAEACDIAISGLASEN